jgi:soluble lytic murein transglycosylase-like protein
MPKRCIPDVIAQPSSRLRPSSFPALATLADPSPAARRRLRWRPFLSGATTFVLLIIGPVANAQPIPGKPSIVSTTADRFGAFVAEAAQRFGIPGAWIRVVMRAESFGEVHAVSPKGAMGLMQIMPETWASLRVRYGLGADPYDPHDNILAGAAYLHELYDRYGSPGFLAAYNAGPTRYEDHLTTGRPLPAETRAYVADIVPLIGVGTLDDTMLVAAVPRAWTEAPLFPMRPEISAQPSQPSSNGPVGQSSSVTTTADWTHLSPRSNGLFVSISQRRSQP